MENNKKLVGAILATGLMSFAGVLIETAMNVTFPTLIDQFTLSTSDVQWVTTIYLLVISIIVPISTYLLKRFSLRTLFLAANAFFLVGLVIIENLISSCQRLLPCWLGDRLFIADVCHFADWPLFPRCQHRDRTAFDVPHHFDLLPL